MASQYLDEAANAPGETCDPSRRTFSFFFAGNMAWRVGNGELRAPVVWEMSTVSPRARVVDSGTYPHEETGCKRGVCGEIPRITGYDAHQLASFASDYAEHMRRAHFCLVPTGDTATSRRLFDAMAAGCKPVFLGRLDDSSRLWPCALSGDQTWELSAQRG